MKFTVPPSQQTPLLLRTFLQSQGFSLTQWRKAKTAGLLKINGQPATASSFVTANDQVDIGYQPGSEIIPANIPLSIIYEDSYMLIVNKPAGLLTHPARDNLTCSLANAVIHYYRQSEQDFGFHPVFRLDRNTSGLVLLAKMPYIQHLLCRQPGSVKKEYLALVAGCPSPEGFIDAPIARHPDSIIERRVDSGGQPAQTRYKVLRDYGQASLVQIELLTGRTHQIRVHFSHIGHPLLGDDLYGGSTALLSRQALHAFRLCFRHPVSGLALELSAPLPPDMEQVMSSLACQ